LSVFFIHHQQTTTPNICFDLERVDYNARKEDVSFIMPVFPFIRSQHASQPAFRPFGAIAMSLSLLLTAGMLTSPLAISAEPTKHQTTQPASATAPLPPKKATPAKKPGAKTSEEKKANKEALAKEVEASIAASTKVDPLTLLKSPDQYVNHKITFTGTFNRFADIGLDYKKAFRDSRDYVTFFILRPDVSERTIPLSEMKLFFPRKQSDEVMELEAGDKIQIVGTLFSAALDEPWIDVAHVKILEKTTKPERKHGSEF
jgi:hypothetical protein